MAKKNLQSLMSGIIGTEPQVQPNEPDNRIQKSMDSIPEEKSFGRGRPRNPDSGNRTRATFIISNDLLKKIKYISLMEESLQMNIVDQALREYIEKWEADNGEIKFSKK